MEPGERVHRGSARPEELPPVHHDAALRTTHAHPNLGARGRRRTAPMAVDLYVPSLYSGFAGP